MKRFIQVVNIISIAILILSLSIAIPIYFRPFYYWQIKPLNIEKASKLSYEQIRYSYDCIMNYLTLFQKFSVGGLRYSENGKAHFHDVRILFIVNFVMIFVSLTIVILIFVLRKKKGYKKEGKFSDAFYSAISLLTIFVFLVFFAVFDFDTLFKVFHKIFFPGKANWLFNPDYDQIIEILPEKFFFNSMIFISSILIVTIFVIITINLVNLKKHKK